MENNKNILLVCFSFPPFPGIGGRRWAKFAKYLAANGYNIHVLAAQTYSDKKSEWTKDVMHENIKLTTIPLGSSKVFSFYPENLKEKILYKLLSIQANLFVKGNKQDKIYFIKEELLKAADKIVSQNNIGTLIVTIPPYKLPYYLLPLKKKYPALKFIVDYRDPWTDNKSYHGFADISKEDLAAEIQFEQEVLNAADVVFDVNSQSLQALRQKTNTKAKFRHLPNGFDKDDYVGIVPVRSDSDQIHFVYTGSFYPNLIESLKPMASCLKRIEKENKALYSRLHFDFYGNMDHKAIEFLKWAKCSAIQFHGNLSQQEVLQKINRANYCMLFSAADHNHALNTKFYEYLYFRKPILFFGGRGDASGFIINNKIGHLFESHQTEILLHDFLTSKELTDYKPDTSVDISAFEIENITQSLIRTINE